MPITKDINKQHVLQAFDKINREGVPPFRGIRKVAVKFEDKLYPCKLVISWANIFLTGRELDPDPRNFQTDMAVAHLNELGFEIVMVTKSPIQN